MPFWRFTIYTAAGCIPWVLMLGVIGVEVGERWEEWRDKLHYFDYVVLAGLLGLVAYFLIKRRRRGKGPGETQDDRQESEPRADAEPATEG